MNEVYDSRSKSETVRRLLKNEGITDPDKVYPWDNLRPEERPDIMYRNGSAAPVRIIVRLYSGRTVTQIPIKRDLGAVDAVLIVNKFAQVYVFLKDVDRFWRIDKGYYIIPVKSVYTWKPFPWLQK